MENALNEPENQPFAYTVIGASPVGRSRTMFHIKYCSHPLPLAF